MNEQALFAQAYRLQHEGNLAEAIASYEQLLKLKPEHIEALHLLALAQAQSGNIDTAIDLFQQALSLTPNDPVLYNNLANAYKKKQRFPDAIHCYQKAIDLLPSYAQAQNNLAGIYALQENYQQALHHYRLAIHAEPDFTAAHYNLGLLLLAHHQLAAAKIQFNNVLVLNPDHIEASFYLGVLNLEANLLAEAEQAFQAVLTADSNHVSALTNLGVIALKKEQAQQAIDYFTKALALDNDHIEARNNLAATFIHFDRFENALMHYDVLLGKDPNNIEYLYNSGVAQMALGHLNEALAHFEHLLIRDEKHFAALNNLAAIYIRLEDREKAKHLLQRAVQANPEDKSSQHMLQALTGSSQTPQTCPEYAANLFNNYALHYDQHLKTYLGYTLPNQILGVLSELNISEVDHTLDLGCGTGLSGQVLRDFSRHLEGVDISGKMLEEAGKKNIYDALNEAEILQFFQNTRQHYNLIIAVDVLPYFGDLSDLFKAVKEHLKPQGYFIFTTEISLTTPWKLQENARFSHHKDYLQNLAGQWHLTCRFQQQVVARQQEGKEVKEFLIALQNDLP